MTPAQNRIYDIVVEKGVFIASNGFERRAADTLVKKGRLVLVGKRRSGVYSLSTHCEKVEARKNEPEPVHEKKVPAYLRAVEDPPKKKLQRPAAVYSNAITGDTLIHHILNTKNGK